MPSPVESRKYTYNYYHPASKPESPPVWFQVLTTIALLIFTCGLWVTSIWQWRAINEQASIANKTLLLQFRPRLIVRNVFLSEMTERPSGETYMLKRGFPVMGQFYVANIGDTSATIKDSFCMVEWRSGGLPMRRPYEGKDGNNPVSGIIQPGDPQTVTFVSDRVLDVDPNDILDPKGIGPLRRELSLYVMGWIEYADELGFVRRMAFCRWLSPVLNYFRPSENPDYEHEE